MSKKSRKRNEIQKSRDLTWKKDESHSRMLIKGKFEPRKTEDSIKDVAEEEKKNTNRKKGRKRKKGRRKG